MHGAIQARDGLDQHVTQNTIITPRAVLIKHRAMLCQPVSPLIERARSPSNHGRALWHAHPQANKLVQNIRGLLIHGVHHEPR
eukprot:3583428-Karenia_brevis.AAC.1